MPLKIHLGFYQHACPDISLKDVFHKFVKEITHITEVPSESQTQQIFNVKQIKKTHITQIPNPKYEEWQTWMETLKTFDNVSNLADTSPPSKLIDTITVTKETISTLVRGGVYKPFDSLYLDEETHHKIYNSIRLFRDKRDLLKSLGLPNKFGLLLYGPAGTGKTSTIYAIATTLNMSIYYVNISPTMTCKDLREIFEHIYQVKGGGIVILEDIDRMTSIVHTNNDVETQEMTMVDVCELFT